MAVARKETFTGADLIAAVNRYGQANVEIAVGPFIVPAPDATSRSGKATGGRSHGGGKWV